MNIINCKRINWAATAAQLIEFSAQIKRIFHHTEIIEEEGWMGWTQAYTETTWKFGNLPRRLLRIFCSERATIAERQGASENKNSEV